MTAAIARAVGTGLALALPAAAIAALRLFPPLEMDPAGSSGWLAPLALGVIALISAISVIPLLGALVSTGRLSAGAAGLSATALTAGTAALALSGPDGAPTLPNSGLALTLIIVAAGLAVAAWARQRVVIDERSRWLGVILALVLAESALAAALLAPGSRLDDVTSILLGVGAVLGAAAAAKWFRRRSPVAALAPLTLVVAAVLLAWARPGTVEAVVAMAPLLVTPLLLVAGLATASTAPRASALRAMAAAARSAESSPRPSTEPVPLRAAGA
ncbi:MAG TPA: hypothetical protein VFP83_01130, partial [Candidatus Limnocylindria bacterium]|nr:hypothetical protein [Candidatus Limnocylindria bacterium]